MRFSRLIDRQQISYIHSWKQTDPYLFFRRKYLRTASVFCGALVLYGISAFLTGFMPVHAVIGIPKGFYWLVRNFCPSKPSFVVFPLILNTLLHTVIIAVAASVTAAAAAAGTALACSRITGRLPIVRILCVAFASFFRNIPLPAWSILLLLSFKQNAITGFFALFFVTTGHLTRTFTEIIDTHAEKSYTALEAAGVSYIPILIHGVMPNIMPLFISWLLYAIETNVRDSALIGILTGTGVGFLFNLYFKSFRYPEAGLIICVIILTVLCIDGISHTVRRILL